MLNTMVVSFINNSMIVKQLNSTVGAAFCSLHEFSPGITGSSHTPKT